MGVREVCGFSKIIHVLIRGAVPKKASILSGHVRWRGEEGEPLSAKKIVSFCWGKQKCLECPETHEYAKKSEFLVRESAKSL